MTTTFIQPDYTFGNSKQCQDQMIGVLSNLDQALQALEPAPNATTVQFNDTIILTDGSTNTNTINNNSINIIDTTNNFTYYSNSSSITIADTTNSINTDIDTSIGFVITDGGNNKSGFLSANQLAINDNTTGEIATLQLFDLTISDNTGQVMTLNKNYFSFTGLNQLDLDNTNTRIIITNVSNSANVVLGNEPALSSSNLLLTNNKDLFFESNTKQVIKYGGAGYGYTPRLLPDNDYIQRYMNCIVYDNGVSVLNLFPRDHYYDTQDSLSDDQRVGWSCKIINYNGVDVQLNSADGTNFFSHFGSLTGNPYTIKKWSSIEIILIYSAVDNTYLWAVSQFN